MNGLCRAIVMPQQPRQPHSLADISHLFLSNLRQRQTNSAAPPQRKPPSPPAEMKPQDDLTPDEFREILAAGDEGEKAPVPPVRALLVSHLAPKHVEYARRYAASMAACGRRVGLIILDSAEFRLITFEPAGSEASAQDCPPTEGLEARAIRDAINELNWDLDCWIMSIANVRSPEARGLLRKVKHWVVLTQPDPQDVVCAYRMLKGVAESPRPRLGIAVMEGDSQKAEQVFRKLSGVCAQFLEWQTDADLAIADVQGVAECQVMCCQAEHDKAQLATAAHWQVVGELAEKAGDEPEQERGNVASSQSASMDVEPTHGAFSTAEESGHEEGTMQAQISSKMEKPAVACTIPARQVAEVVELTPDSDESILAAVMKHSMPELMECPVRPPMCPKARLAVSRDGCMVLTAAAGQGLGELHSIGRAYAWVIENRALIGMALPQLALDAHQHPQLRLLVEQSEADAEILQPVLQASMVSIHTYRRVRWGQRMGLLLEAA